MTLLDRAYLTIVLGEYGTSHARHLSDPNLWPLVQEYRRLVSSRMRPLARDDLSKRLPAGEYHVSKKIDGEFAVLIVDGDDAMLLNPGGTVRVGLPLIAEAAASLRKAGLKRAMVAGEFYVARPDGKRARVHDVGTVAATPESPDALSTLRFAPFDMMEPKYATHAETWKVLQEIFGKGKLARIVEGEWVESTNDVVEKFAAWVEQEGHEGLVIRSDLGGLYKAKTKHTVDAVVIGFAEGVDDRKGMVHDMLLALMRKDKTFHLMGRVGGGLTDELRQSLLSDLSDDVVPSDYAEINSEHVAYQMVRPTRVVEISCLDLLATSTRGAPIQRMVLSWNGSDNRWGILRPMPLVNIISPVFKRFREDKQCLPEHIGIDQLDRIVPIADANRDASNLVLPKSEILRREVYTKTMKGQKMVRKLVLWKTHKEEISETHPGYVLHLTDYSPNRKTPLERDICVSNDRAQLDAVWEEMAKAKLGRGWAKV
jgi:hypothetical protein